MFEQDIYKHVLLHKAKRGTKEFLPGKPVTSIDAPGNKLGRNGSGRVLVVDVDTKNGGSVAELARAFPGVAERKTVTVSTPSGGVHLVYSLAEEQNERIRTRTGSFELVQGVEIPPYYMVPGSEVRGANGVFHRYVIGDVIDPAPCPLDLWAVVAQDGEELEVARDPISPRGAEHLLEKWAYAPPGQRNERFKEIAFPVFHALGVEEGALAIEQNDPGWDNLEWALKSAVSAFEDRGEGEELTFTVNVASRTRRILLEMLEYDAVLGSWKGRGAANDRRVFLTLLDRATDLCELVVEYPLETIATHAGIKPDSVREALDRLEKQGRIARCFPDDPHKINLSCSVLGCYLTIKGEYPKGDIPGNGSYPVESTVHPLDELWRCNGLTGRHGHLFALIDNGVGSGAELVRRSGASRATVSETLKALRKVGLIEDSTEGLAVAPGVDEEFVHGLCMDLGGYEARLRVKERISRDHERLEQWKFEERRANDERYRRAMDRPDNTELLDQLGLEG